MRLAVGLLVGAAFTSAGLWLAGDGSPSAKTEPFPDRATTTTSSVDDVWFEPGEARFENTVLLPRALTVESGTARFEYDLVTVASTGLAAFGAEVPAGAMPSRFVLVTTSGVAIEADVSRPEAPLVVFEGVELSGVDDVAEIRLVEWRVQTPLQLVVTVPATVGASAELPDGSTFTLDVILEQRNGSILQFDLEEPEGQWSSRSGSFFSPESTFTGEGLGWRSASTTSGGFQLTRVGPEVPDEISIRVNLVPWHPVTGSVPVPLPEPA